MRYEALYTNIEDAKVVACSLMKRDIEFEFKSQAPRHWHLVFSRTSDEEAMKLKRKPNALYRHPDRDHDFKILIGD